MADETKVEEKVNVVAEASEVAEAAPAKAGPEAAPVAALKVKPAAKRGRGRPASSRARKTPAKVVEAVKTVNRRAAKSVRGARKAAEAKPAASARKFEGTNNMTYDFNKLFAGFQLPGADRYQQFVAEAGERGQELAARSQKAAEELTDITRANVEAVVEAGKIAATGAKALGQDVIASSREGIEQASDAVKSLAEARSPAEFFQIQSELARASFDRLVAETSKLTERVVKLAGEAAEPIQARASLNAERINSLVA